MMLMLDNFLDLKLLLRNGTDSKAFRAWGSMSIEDATEMVREHVAEAEGHSLKVNGLLKKVEPGMAVSASCKAMQCLRTFSAALS